MLSLHGQFLHFGTLGRQTDVEIIRLWGPPTMKTVWNGIKPPYLYALPLGSALLWREYPLSEQFNGPFDLGAGRAMAEFGTHEPLLNAAGLPQNGSGRDKSVRFSRDLTAGDLPTPEQAAQVFVDNAVAVAAYCATQGVGQDRLYFESVNEYPVWAFGYEGLARLETRRLQLMHKALPRAGCVVSNLGVGWPGNTGKDTPPVWEWARTMIAAFGNRDILGGHEYCGLNGIRENWGWWMGRILKCPYQVPLWITESGIDGGVYGASFAKKGYRSLPGSEDQQVRRCQDEMWEYAAAISADGRGRQTFQYTYDGNRDDWIEFDIRTEAFIRPFLARIQAQGLPIPGVQPPVIEPPVVPPTPAQTIVGQIISQAPNDGTSYVEGYAWQDGVEISFAWRGNPQPAATCITGPHAGYPGWQPGFYSLPLFVNAQTPCQGEWDIWATADGLTSARVPFVTDGKGGAVNQVRVDFSLVTPAAPATLADLLRAQFGAKFTDLRATLTQHATLKYATRQPAAIARLILHHTAMPQTGTWEAVALYHVNSRGWPGIGYHIGVHADGRVALLNSAETISYHAGDATRPGDENADSLAIAVMGNFEVDPLPAGVWENVNLVAGIVRDYLGRQVPMLGHRDAASGTVCPGKNLYAKLVAPVEQEYLPRYEPVMPLLNLARAWRWWEEEAIREAEAGHAARAAAIRLDLIDINAGLAYRLERALANQQLVG